VNDHRIEGVGDVDAEDLLALLDGDNVHDVGPDELGFSCFYIAGHSHGDQNPSAHINRDSLLWRCKGCGRSGNLLELVKLALPLGTKHTEAMAWLREHFGEVVRKPRGGSLRADLEHRLARARVSHPERRLPGEAETIGRGGIFYMDWTSDHEAAVYMRGRGFSPETLADWNVGWDSWSRRVAIAIRDETGILVGFKGRAIDNREPKYLLLGDTEGRELRYSDGYGFDMHDAREVLFGLDRAIRSRSGTGSVPAELRPNQPGQPDVRGVRPRQQSPAADQSLVVCEGELDAIACHAAGVTNAVALGTKSITARQLWLLRTTARVLVFFLDSDDAGQDAVWGFVDDELKRHPGHVEKLSPHFVLLVTDDHEDDAAAMAPADVRRLTDGAQHWLRYAIPSEPAV
jgi:DNA primase